MEVGYVTLLIDMQNLKINTWKIMIKMKNRHILNIATEIICMVGQCCKKYLTNGFDWVEDLAEFNEHFMKSYDDKSNEEYLLELHVKYSENLHDLQNDLPFSPKRMKIWRKKIVKWN